MNTTPPFVAEARLFISRTRGSLAFRLMRWYFRCSAEDLDQAIGKIYCYSRRENSYALPESRVKSALGILTYPLFALARKSWLWMPAPRTVWNFETIDTPYFDRWFSRVFAALPGEKRISPRGPFDKPGVATTRPYSDSVRLDDIVKLLLLGFPLTAALWALSRRERLDLMQAARHALTLFTVFHGYFTRYPCRHFVTYDDEQNPPARVLAFRRRSDGEFIVIQNGERSRHPYLAFGLMDRYFVFGPAYESILRAIGTRAARWHHIGAACLNYHYPTIKALRERGGGAELYDVLFIDQGIYPHNGLNERSGRSLETIMERLGQLKARRPELRLAYQLRKYHPEQAALKRLVTDTVTRFCGPNVAVLDNPDGAESYRNCLCSRLVMTFESTLGFEALMLGRPVLFVNFSGDPAETLCPDPRFQLEDPQADYDRFEAKVLETLALRLESPPPVATERHFLFDGCVQERLAEALRTLAT